MISRGTTVAGRGTAVPKCAAQSRLPIGSALAIGSHIARVSAGAEQRLAAGTAVGRRRAAVATGGTAIATCRPCAVVLRRSATGAVWRRISRARSWCGWGITVAVQGLAAESVGNQVNICSVGEVRLQYSQLLGQVLEGLDLPSVTTIGSGPATDTVLGAAGAPSGRAHPVIVHTTGAILGHDASLPWGESSGCCGALSYHGRGKDRHNYQRLHIGNMCG